MKNLVSQTEIVYSVSCVKTPFMVSFDFAQDKLLTTNGVV
jgi:hypothetical protein